ncbi:MAG: GntR family transcriptional regulator [Candidatus Gastranaerophilales bacterium]|nr:GntR family transcriptional regulator [Candidatus Gastranaerophilales bacterium]
MKKNTQYKRILISELPISIPNFKETTKSKDTLIQGWLTSWIIEGLRNHSLEETNLLPQKQELANYLGVSIGTVQNAIRYVEDEGILISKQKIGTMIVNPENPSILSTTTRKLTSKRDKIIEQVKKLIIDEKIKINQAIPSSRKLASTMKVSANTTRLAYEYLCKCGILESRLTRGNDANWILKRIPEFNETTLPVYQIQSDTLVSKVSEDLKQYISKNLKVSDKLPAHQELSTILNVSIKTIHDALKNLINEGILLSRRGRYGTIVVKMPNAPTLQPLKENSIFAKAEDAAFYCYQKIEENLVKLIRDTYDIGEKLPSMDDLAKQFDVSTNTIRKALQNMSKQGIVQFGRGRYGGTFVTDIPESNETETFRWLAVNPSYVHTYAN